MGRELPSLTFQGTVSHTYSPPYFSPPRFRLRVSEVYSSVGRKSIKKKNGGSCSGKRFCTGGVVYPWGSCVHIVFTRDFHEETDHWSRVSNVKPDDVVPFVSHSNCSTVTELGESRRRSTGVGLPKNLTLSDEILLFSLTLTLNITLLTRLFF